MRFHLTIRHGFGFQIGVGSVDLMLVGRGWSTDKHPSGTPRRLNALLCWGSRTLET